MKRPLVTTAGSDFEYVDRNTSFKVLADHLVARYDYFLISNRAGFTSDDRNHFAIPFLAAGPGTGKSRFLQELPFAFKKYVSEIPGASKLTSALSDAVYVNISFGNGSGYTSRDVELGIEKALSIRIIEQFQTDGHEFAKEYDSSIEGLLTYVIKTVAANASGVVLGIDEVNKVYELDQVQFKALFNILGSLSCSSRIFLLPIFAGTVIGPIESVVKGSTHPPLPIPLPLLSFKSCQDIIAKKDPARAELVRTNPYMIQLVYDIGGHCRALEMLYSALRNANYNPKVEGYWELVINDVRRDLLLRYPISTTPAYMTAIVCSFLSYQVARGDKVIEGEPATFLNLEEAGLITIGDQGQIQIPFVFVWSYLNSNLNDFTRFWKDILIGKDFWWQDWEKFNQNYLAFRLSLYSFLGFTEISLKTLFNGAKINIPGNIIVQIPPLKDMTSELLTQRFPTSISDEFPIGQFVLNASGAPFDAFVYLSTKDNKRILIAEEMKFANANSVRKQILTTEIMLEQYKKVNDAIYNHIRGTDFVFVILARCEGQFDASKIPINGVAVSMSEFRSFYGDAYYQRLKMF